MYCANCGNEVQNGADVCTNCGKALPVQDAVQQSSYDPTRSVMSVGSYIGVFLLSAIPIVNIVCWIVWLVSPNTNRNKKNYIIANIVLFVVGFLLSILVVVIAGAFGVKTAGFNFESFISPFFTSVF